MVLKKGTSIAGVLVAAALGGVLMVGLSKGVLQNMQMTKGVDNKLQIQDFSNLVRMSTINPATCNKVFDFDNNEILILKTELQKLNTRAIPSVKVPISTITIAQSDLVTNPTGQQNVQKDLIIRDLSLDLVNVMSSDFTQIHGILSYAVALKSKPSTPISGGNTNILFTLMPATNATQMKLLSCFSESTLEGRSICNAVKGRWLEATQTGQYMPTERCSLGGEIALGPNEAPDGINTDGGMSDAGERADMCLFASDVYKDGKWRGYTNGSEACGYATYPRAGYRCYFEPVAREWQKRYFNANSKAPNSIIYRRCNKGVKVSSKSLTEEPLEMNMALHDSAVEGLSNDVPWNDTDYSRRLQSVGACKPAMDYDRVVPCTNPTDPNAAQLGLAGSCIFVKNSLLNGGVQAQMKLFLMSALALNTLTTTGAEIFNVTRDNYFGLNNTALKPVSPAQGGWIQVNIPRAIGNRKIAGDLIGLDYITEARGSPCYQVQINASALNIPEVTLSTPGGSGHALPGAVASAAVAPSSKDIAIIANVDKISECHYESKALLTPIAIPGVGAVAKDNVIKSDYPVVFRCSNAGLDITLNDEFAPKGSCWYFQDVLLTGFKLRGLARYTGWVYLKAEAANALIKRGTGDFLTGQVAASVINGLPCNKGIALTN